MQENKKYRLVTRSNLDGIVSAVFLKKMNMVDEVVFVHPKDMQDGIVPVNSNDIVTNLPYVKGVYMSFDYSLGHSSTDFVLNENHLLYTDALSASEVVYRTYQETFEFSKKDKELLDVVQRAKTSSYTQDEVLNPKGWDLLSFIMDSRTGLGRFKDFRISNYSLMMDLIDYCEKYSIEEILELPDVKERVELYKNYQDKFISQLKECSTVEDNVLVVDLTEQETIYPGNRFMVYSLFPQISVSVYKMKGLKNQNTVFAVGKSIFNDSLHTNIAEVVSRHNGGGHEFAGSCQVEHSIADEVLEDIVETLKERSLCSV